MAGGFYAFVLTSLVAVFSIAEADPDFCHRGFQIAQKFHGCWGDATYAHPYHKLHKPKDNLFTGELLEEYATHMCSVVKPIALECLRQEVSVCSNAAKLYKTADASGGACHGADMNPHFKQYITRLLKPVAADSPCFMKADEAYTCYTEAAKMVLDTDSGEDISRFYKVADKFFNYIWSCHIKLYKGMSDVCPNWQIPMLISLQNTAMPSLFGMKLNNHQIGMLGLGVNPKDMVVPTPTTKAPDCKDGAVSRYMLLRVIKDKTDAKPGDIVLQLGASADTETLPELKVDGSENDMAKDFLKEVILDGAINMRAVKKWVREEQLRRKASRKNAADLTDYIKGFNPDKKRKGKKSTTF